MGMQEVQAALAALGGEATVVQIRDHMNQGRTRATISANVLNTLLKLERREQVICTKRGRSGGAVGANASAWMLNPDAARKRPVICETVVRVNNRTEKRWRAYCTVTAMCGWVGSKARSEEAALASLNQHKRTQHAAREEVVLVES